MCFRIALAMFCGTTCYMIAMVMTLHDDMIAAIVLPIAGLFFSAIACGILLLGKLPLKYAPWLREAWNRQWYASAIIAVAGIVAMVLSWHPAWRVQVLDGEFGRHLIDSFHPVLGIGGWLAMMFGILFYPTRPGKPKPRVRPSQLEW